MKKRSQQIELEKALRLDRALRVAYCEHDFPWWFVYHFGWLLKQWQYEWLEALASGDSVIIKAFRASRKTTMVRAECVWCICYAKEPSIVVQSYEGSLSSAWVRQVAKMLFTQSIIDDYGPLFPGSMDRSSIANKAGASNFESLTGTKIFSTSLGEILRGENSYDIQAAMSSRPTYLVLDDIDVHDSVKNERIISDNEQKLLSETIGAMDPLRQRITFLGNVISTDGILPRFVKRYTGQKGWQSFSQPLFDDEGVNVWPEVMTDEIVARLRSHGSTSFAQNYLLLPYREGDIVISRADCKHGDWRGKVGRVVMGIDPAGSKKTLSDAFAIALALHCEDGRQYVMRTWGLNGREKDTNNVVSFIKSLWVQFHVEYANVESNGGQSYFADILRNEGLAVNEVPTTTDKVSNLMKYQGGIQSGNILFDLENLVSLIDQLEAFPNAAHDDEVDAMMRALIPRADWDAPY